MSDLVLLDVQLAPRWELISELRRLVDAALSRLKLDADAAYGASLAAHELLENAVKYGHGRVQVRVVLDRALKKVRRVAVVNRTTFERIEDLKRRLSDLRRSKDPMRKYLELMGTGKTGGLGLARVAAEACMTLRCTVRANEVAVLAVPGGIRG